MKRVAVQAKPVCLGDVERAPCPLCGQLVKVERLWNDTPVFSRHRYMGSGREPHRCPSDNLVVDPMTIRGLVIETGVLSGAI
jgi:hypothetical protein